jgi:hypothetical protein
LNHDMTAIDLLNDSPFQNLPEMKER